MALRKIIKAYPYNLRRTEEFKRLYKIYETVYYLLFASFLMTIILVMIYSIDFKYAFTMMSSVILYDIYMKFRFHRLPDEGEL